jgi:hypothetical protein
MSDLILPPGARSSSGPKEYSLFPSGASVQKSDLGAPNIRTSSSHNVRKFRDQRFWADGGRIQIVDDKTGDHTSASIDDFGQRAIALILQVRNMQRIGYWTDECHEIVKAIGDMKEVLYEAKEQGDPHDPEVLKYKMRQRGRKFTIGGLKGHHVTEGPISGRRIGKQSDAGRIYLK